MKLLSSFSLLLAVIATLATALPASTEDTHLEPRKEKSVRAERPNDPDCVDVSCDLGSILFGVPDKCCEHTIDFDDTT